MFTAAPIMIKGNSFGGTMFLKGIVLICLLVMIQSCAFRFKEFEGKPDEDVVYNRIQELKKSERYILASEYVTFPRSLLQPSLSHTAYSSLS